MCMADSFALLGELIPDPPQDWNLLTELVKARLIYYILDKLRINLASKGNIWIVSKGFVYLKKINNI